MDAEGFPEVFPVDAFAADWRAAAEILDFGSGRSGEDFKPRPQLCFTRSSSVLESRFECQCFGIGTKRVFACMLLFVHTSSH